MQPCQENSRSFFEKLQNAKGLDLRDNRGKKHDLAVVLVGVDNRAVSESGRLLFKYSPAFGESLRAIGCGARSRKKATGFAFAIAADFRESDRLGL